MLAQTYRLAAVLLVVVTIVAGHKKGTFGRPCLEYGDCDLMTERCADATDEQQPEDAPTGKICVCQPNAEFDVNLQECVAIDENADNWCEDWCLRPGRGDTCRRGMCRTCWADDMFTCDEFMPPTERPLIIVHQSPFMSSWLVSFFFLFLTLMFFTCLMRCCLYSRIQQRRSLMTTTTAAAANVAGHPAGPTIPTIASADQSAYIKMPLDAGHPYAGGTDAHHVNELPPPYRTA